ncbi:MAG: formate dehydrogenase subunit alpha [Eubacteriales bacterium]
MAKVKINVNGKDIYGEKGESLLKVALENGIEIPNLCYHKDLEIENGASCRLCLVEIEGIDKLVPACATNIKEGMKVETESKKAVDNRKMILDMMISDHPLDCLTCEKAGDCKLQDYCYKYDIKEGNYKNSRNSMDIDYTNEFFIRDNNKCILCGLCVRACSELQVIDALTFANRGEEMFVTTGFHDKLKEGPCVSCGTCVSLCPVDALRPKKMVKYRTWETKKVRTTCPYCGVGCQMNLVVKGNEVVEVEPYYGESNKGLLCVKGKFAYGFINHKDRLKKPLIKKHGEFVEASWEEAYDLIISKILEAKEKYGNDSLAGLSSARVTNEENYLFQKMVRGYFGNNNVDHCARLCHASTVTGLATTLGSGAMTNSNKEILDSDVIFVTGSNTTETHPVLGAFIKQAKNKGAKLIVADPRTIPLAEKADIYLPITPGTNVALANGLMHVIIKEELQDLEYIKEKTEDYHKLVEVVEKYTPEVVGDICGVNPEDIIKAARYYGKGEKASIFYSMGVTQHTTGTQGVMSLANLAMLCGNIGKESAGINPLRGQNNVQGACDLGALPNVYPGYQKINDKTSREKFEKAWDKKLDSIVGLTVTEMFKKGFEGKLKFLYIMGENPMISDPDLSHVKESLDNIDFIVVQDIFRNETAEFADVILPASSFAEKDGTFTNSERRVQRVRKAINPIGESKADWIIIKDILKRLGMKENYNNPQEIAEEISSLTPQYAGINYNRIEEVGLQWPCTDDKHPGTKYLHKDNPARGKGLFIPAEYAKSNETPCDDYPYILTTGRILYHYHTRTMTGRIEGLNNLYSESFVEINPLTARGLDIEDGEIIVVSSRRGSIKVRAFVTEDIKEGVVFIPFHFAEGPANCLTNPKLDPIAKIPELKVSTVNIRKLYKTEEAVNFSCGGKI